MQWFVDWDATAGTHYVAVRAVNKNGDLQIEERAPIAPDGSTGWQRTLITWSTYDARQSAAAVKRDPLRAETSCDSEQR